MDFAVIKTGGKQYIVSPGEKIKIEKLETESGKEIIFDQVLLLEKNPSSPRSSGQVKLEIGKPFISGAKVTGKVVSQGKGDKIVIFKYKAKKRYKVKTGHRQPFTEIEILKIESA